ncbi:hypothetical protein RND81_02G018300 [Saponaria officinalis]|uniref:Translation initiation factor IF-1, chloroplastic n=1 Tax=Saponaria officinalis TaxID=3572 RepID=A0AAW1MRG8_SAPOF
MGTTTMNALQSSYLLHHSSSTKLNPLSSPKFPHNSTSSTTPNNQSKPVLLNPVFSSISNSSSSSSTNNKEQKWVHEGTISESLPNGMFWVNCDNGDVILGYVSGKMRRGSIRILPGDRVKVEVSRYDSTRGRIIYRTRG